MTMGMASRDSKAASKEHIECHGKSIMEKSLRVSAFCIGAIIRAASIQTTCFLERDRTTTVTVTRKIALLWAKITGDPS